MSLETLANLKPKDIAGKLAKNFIYNPLTALLAIFLLAIGYLALEIMPREEDPQIAISGGSIIVAAPGLNSQEIEKLITDPLEQKLREVNGIEHIYSVSTDNVGIVNVIYYIGQNREISNLKIYDKVMQNIDLLPKNAMQPLIKPLDIDIDIPIVTIAFYQKNNTLPYHTFVQKIEELKKEISMIENVSKTTIKGAKKEQFNIEVDLGKLRGYNLSLGQIAGAITAISTKVPHITNETKDGKLVVFGIKNAIETTEDVGNIMIARYGGSAIYLRDIAKITQGIDHQNPQSGKLYLLENGTIQGYDQVTLMISKLAGTNAVFVADDINELLVAKQGELEHLGIGTKITRNYGERANEAVNELVHHLIITIVIIAVMLVFFLGWKESLIVTFTVPAILAVTLFVAYMGDQTINRITLFAFLLSLGLLVDAAIIVIENIHRHLHTHGSEERDMDELLVSATDEIGAPTNIATLAIILTMVPMAFVGGMMGEFMKPIPYNVPIALIASLFVAYIFTPYLSKKLIKKTDDGAHRHTTEGGSHV